MNVECWVLKQFADLRITFMALVQLGIANSEVIDAEKCTVNHSFKWLLWRCLLSGLRDLAPGQACERCGKGLIESKIQKALSGMPAQLIERVNARALQIQERLQLEKRFDRIENLVKTEIGFLSAQVQQLEIQLKAIQENIVFSRTDHAELKKLVETQAEEIQKIKKDIEEMYKKMGHIDSDLFMLKILSLKRSINEASARFSSFGLPRLKMPVIKQIPG